MDLAQAGQAHENFIYGELKPASWYLESWIMKFDLLAAILTCGLLKFVKNIVMNCDCGEVESFGASPDFGMPSSIYKMNP